MRFLPREEKFFVYFLTQVNLIAEAAAIFVQGVKAGNSSLAGAAAKITDLEHKGDEVIHEIFTKLNQTFITPIDPEDIHALSSHLDDVLDYIEDAAHRIVAYRINPIPPAVIELVVLVERSAQYLKKAFEALEKNQPFLDECIEVNRLEGEADRLTRAVIADLFQSEKDPIQLIKLKEIYELLEHTTDVCEDVTDVLQNVIVKNS